MARRVPENLPEQGIAKPSTSMSLPEEPQCSMRKWYFTRKEIEDYSPSRKDGISLKKESQLRKAYCSFLQEVGMKLKVPQLTIACAMMLCHRFYMRQSHAKNDWQRIATASIFLACKVEETPRFLNDVVVVAYEMVHKLDSSALQSIRQRDVFNKQKESVIVGERFLLSAIGFDFEIQLPYKILVTALKRLNIFPDLAKVAWNFVNDWLHTSLCLQYKPHYIAAGSMSLAAGIQKVKLPTEKGHVWWLEFDVSPKQLDEVIQGMRSMLKPDRKQAPPPKNGRVIQSENLSRKPSVSSSQSCVTSELTVDPNSRQGGLGEDKGLGESVMSNSQNLVEGGNSVIMKEALHCQSSDSGSASGIVEYAVAQIKPIRGELDDQNSRCKIVHEHNNCSTVMSNSQNLVEGNNSVTMKEALPYQTSDSGSVSGIVEDAGAEIKPVRGELDCQKSRCEIFSVHNNSSKIDINRIRETLKRRRGDKVASKNLVDVMDDEIDAEAWIQSELENGVELDDTSTKKKQRKAA